MICLQRISDDVILQTWPAVPRFFACPLGEVHGAVAGWESGDYRLIEVPDPAPAPPTVAELKAYAAAKRWAVETGGIVLPGGVQVTTDERTRGVITAAYVQAGADPAFTIPNWKLATGVYVTLDAATIFAIGDAITAHVQACFSANAAIDSRIADETYTTYADIETAVEWPANNVVPPSRVDRIADLEQRIAAADARVDELVRVLAGEGTQ